MEIGKGRKSSYHTLWSILYAAYMISNHFSTHKRPRNAPFVANSKWKRYMKNPRQFDDDSMAASSIGKFKFFDSKKLDAANARRNKKYIK